jgi:HlyD family secretion protein
LEQNVRDDGPVLSQLSSAVEQAREKLAVDSTNLARQQALWAQQIGSRNDLDQRELAYTTSRTTYDRAVKSLVENRAKLQTELSVARNNLAISAAGNDDRTPRSLIDGIVYDLMIEPGELATTQRAVWL